MLFISIALSIIILIPIFLLSAWVSIKIDVFLNRYDNKDLDSINKRIEKLRRQYNRSLGQDAYSPSMEIYFIVVDRFNTISKLKCFISHWEMNNLCLQRRINSEFDKETN